MLKGFKQFMLRGNVVDLAVAVVMGAAFGAVISALVKDLLTPLVAAVFGQPDFSTLAFTVNGSRFAYGDFLNAVVAFVLVGAAIYFAVVVPLNAVRGARPGKDTRKCPECLSEVPSAARRCAHCTSMLEAEKRAS
ncbi:MAG TPA: large conductance mechanosensitive channel protein MscL [Myxococcales bacterium]|jgi:large conductance mechanosensitive channel